VVKNIYEYYAKWIREGRLKVNSDWNRDLKIKFTVQDPCQIVRKSYGDPIAERTCATWSKRWSVKRTSSTCSRTAPTTTAAAAGGGFLQSGFKAATSCLRKLKGRTDQGHRG